MAQTRSSGCGSSAWRCPDGTWGGLGKIVRLPDIAGFTISDKAERTPKSVWPSDDVSEAVAILQAAGVESLASA